MDSIQTAIDMQGKLIEYRIATDIEINLVTEINGFNIDTMEQILYVRTGYRTFEQMEES